MLICYGFMCEGVGKATLINSSKEMFKNGLLGGLRRIV